MQIKKIIPNTITSMNLICGIVGVVLTLGGSIPCAFAMMLLAAVADFFDGLAARTLNAYSDIGKELDSLCDNVSFGVLPALMMSSILVERHGWSNPVCWIPLLISVFSALRLAKFNIDTRQSMSFIGLPTPACAMICGSLCHLAATAPDSLAAGLCGSIWFIPALSIILSVLLVCELPMFSMKFHKGDGLGIDRMGFLACVPVAIAATIIFGWPWSAAVFTIFIAYIAINAVKAFSR